MLALSMLVYFNFLTLIILLIPKKQILPFATELFIGGLIVSYIINYFIFIHTRKYLKVFKMFENESRVSLIVRRIFVAIYVVISLISVYDQIVYH
jgi:hypothetical protein